MPIVRLFGIIEYMPMPKKLKIIILFLFVCLSVSSFFLIKAIGMAADTGSSPQANEEVRNLNSQIEERKKRLKEIQDQQTAYSQAIREKQSEQASLGSQLSIIDNRAKKAELDIAETEVEIDRTQLEIQKTQLEIKEKEDEIQTRKEYIGKVLRLVYKQDDVSSLEALLLNDSFSEFLNQLKYLEDVNSEIQEALGEVKDRKAELDKIKIELDAKAAELAKFKAGLEEKKQNLAVEYDNKNYLLEETRQSESQYQSLLSQAKREQAAAAADISNLEKTVRERLTRLDPKKLEYNDSGMIWPVARNVVTATFHDPDYPFRFVFEHPAVDIRAGQGTPIKAASSGYVARAKNGGKAYSYIMLIHGDGLATVYGHVSKIYVEEDEYVTQGQVIGLSGGMPGTPGAGPLTTGPHLHFEVRLNGIPVNPLEYLP